MEKTYTESEVRKQKSISVLSDAIQCYTHYFQDKLGCVAPHWKKSNPKYYSFIPSSPVSAIDCITKAKDCLESKPSGTYKFLDCGCGIGNILMIAEIVGFEAAGIEYEADTVALANDMMKSVRSIIGREPKIIKGDILHFRHYEDYDVIYYYAPIKDPEMHKQFVKKLMRDSKVGALIIEYGGSNILRTDSRFVSVCDSLGTYKKASN